MSFLEEFFSETGVLLCACSLLSLKQAVLSNLLSLRNIFLRKREGFFSKGGEVQAHYAPLNYHTDAHIRCGSCLDRSCRLRGTYELDCYHHLGL